jgi:hypothetical protein
VPGKIGTHHRGDEGGKGLSERREKGEGRKEKEDEEQENGEVFFHTIYFSSNIKSKT